MTEGKSATSIRDSWQGKGLHLGDKLGFAPLLWQESQLKLDIAFFSFGFRGEREVDKR